jgi:uncharacterized protein YjcR
MKHYESKVRRFEWYLDYKTGMRKVEIARKYGVNRGMVTKAINWCKENESRIYLYL